MSMKKPKGFSVKVVFIFVIIFGLSFISPCYAGKDDPNNPNNTSYTRSIVNGLTSPFRYAAGYLPFFGARAEEALSIKIDGKVSSPQKTNEPFQIKIQANDPGFNGTVYLHSAMGEVEPNQVDLVNGQWTGGITLHEIGANNCIELHWDDADKKHNGVSISNTFDTIDKSNSVSGAILKGEVTDSFDQPVVGATVLLFSGNKPLCSTTTDGNGAYIFPNAPYGVHRIEIKKDDYHGLSQRVKIAAKRTVTTNIVLHNVCSSAQGQVPVLLVPGIMGSYSKVKPYLWPYPRLSPNPPAWDSGELALLDPFRAVGWEKLTKALQQEGYVKGCTIFHVPYDWSLSIPAIRDQYLIPWIKKAKEISGSKKVDIIAHSMGGLVARSYIQSKSYENDVRKFAMLGTPNQGATSVYYIWESGDPLTLDAISGNTHMFGSTSYFYTNTIDYFIYDRCWSPVCRYSELRKYKPQYCDKNRICDMVHGRSISSSQLMPVYENALKKEDGQNQPIGKEENTFLKALNKQQCLNPMGCVDHRGGLYSYSAPESVFTKEPNTDKVETMLFIGTDQKTIESIEVTPQSPEYTGKLNKDGVPQRVNTTIKGDGTVLEKSVLLSQELGLNYKTKSSWHSGLVANFVPEILDFIKPGAGERNLQLLSVAPATTLVINNSGRVQLQLSEISNTTSPEEEKDALIKNIKSEHTNAASSMVLENLIDGKYKFTLASLHHENYELSIAYYNEKTKNLVTKKYLGLFDDGSLQQFGLTIDSNNTASPVEFDDLHFKTPTDLNIINENNKVRLEWGDGGEEAAGYEIYCRKRNQHYMRYLASTTDRFYTTEHDWKDITADNYIYAVRSVLKNGKGKTFFSEPTFFVHELDKVFVSED